MFFDRYSALCKKIGKTPTGVALELNVSRATVNYWKNGNVPKQKILIKIADYFGVSTDYLLGNEKTSAENGEGNNIERFTVYAMNGSTPGARHIDVNMDTFAELNELIHEAQDLPKEKLQALIAVIKNMK